MPADPGADGSDGQSNPGECSTPPAPCRGPLWAVYAVRPRLAASTTCHSRSPARVPQPSLVEPLKEARLPGVALAQLPQARLKRCAPSVPRPEVVQIFQ